MIACNARKSVVVSVMRTVCSITCFEIGFSNCVFGWVGRAGPGWAFYGKERSAMWRLGEEHLNPFFMDVEAFASKLTVVVLLGRDPISNNQITTAECRRLKRSKSGKRLGFVSPKWLLLITWLGWIHLTWLGGWIWCLPPLLSWDIVPAQPGGNHQFHPQSSSTASFLEQNLGFTCPPSCSIIPAQFFYACHVVVHETSKLW